MRAGRLRHKIIIEENTGGRSARGGRTDTWTAFLTVRASVQPLSGRELIAAAQSHAALSHKVVIRHVDGITPAMRVNHGGRKLKIDSIINVNEAGRELHLMCEEITE